jgi:hypothetical protein
VHNYYAVTVTGVVWLEVVLLLTVSGFVRWGLVTIRKSLLSGEGGSSDSCHRMSLVLSFLDDCRTEWFRAKDTYKMEAGMSSCYPAVS